MDWNTFSALADFRHNIYAAFGNGRDALFDACDALLTETQARSFIELSLSPLFTRRWASLYQCVQNARINRDALRETFAHTAPVPAQDKRLLLGVDASNIARTGQNVCASKQSARRKQTDHTGLAVLHADRAARHARQLEVYSGQ